MRGPFAWLLASLALFVARSDDMIIGYFAMVDTDSSSFIDKAEQARSRPFF